MSWKEKQCRASAIVPSAKGSKVNDLDMAARRILEGLGLSTRSFYNVELQEFDTNYVDECLWSRVQRYFYKHTQSLQTLAPWNSLVFCEPKDLPSKLKVAMLTVQLPTTNQVFVYREGQECFCELLASEIAVDLLCLQPPYLAMKWLTPGILIIKMKAKDFAKQYAIERNDEPERSSN